MTVFPYYSVKTFSQVAYASGSQDNSAELKLRIGASKELHTLDLAALKANKNRTTRIVYKSDEPELSEEHKPRKRAYLGSSPDKAALTGTKELYVTIKVEAVRELVIFSDKDPSPSDVFTEFRSDWVVFGSVCLK